MRKALPFLFVVYLPHHLERIHFLRKGWKLFHHFHPQGLTYLLVPRYPGNPQQLIISEQNTLEFNLNLRKMQESITIDTSKQACEYCDLKRLTSPMRQQKDAFNYYFAKPITEILSDSRLPHVIKFKDLLIWDNHKEHLKRVYQFQQSIDRIWNISRLGPPKSYRPLIHDMDIYKIGDTDRIAPQVILPAANHDFQQAFQKPAETFETDEHNIYSLQTNKQSVEVPNIQQIIEKLNLRPYLGWQVEKTRFEAHDRQCCTLDEDFRSEFDGCMRRINQLSTSKALGLMQVCKQVGQYSGLKRTPSSAGKEFQIHKAMMPILQGPTKMDQIKRQQVIQLLTKHKPSQPRLGTQTERQKLSQRKYNSSSSGSPPNRAPNIFHPKQSHQIKCPSKGITSDDMLRTILGHQRLQSGQSSFIQRKSQEYTFHTPTSHRQSSNSHSKERSQQKSASQISFQKIGPYRIPKLNNLKEYFPDYNRKKAQSKSKYGSMFLETQGQGIGESLFGFWTSRRKIKPQLAQKATSNTVNQGQPYLSFNVKKIRKTDTTSDMKLQERCNLLSQWFNQKTQKNCKQ